MDAGTPLVSVIMSVHNGEQWLDEAIVSIIRQTYPNWEFIIIDDASNEATKERLLHYSIDSRIKIVRKETQQGLTKNLNTAIDLCKGHFIARMDADDISVHERLEKQLDYLVDHPEVAVVAGFIDIMDDTGRLTGIWPDDRRADSWKKIKARLPWKSCIAHPTVMFRKEVLQQYRYNESQTHSQDWDLWMRLAADGKIIEKIKEPLLLYRVHYGSVTSKTIKKSAFLKKHETYRHYLRGSKLNGFNTKVWIGFVFNRIKLFLSRIKRRFTS
jgi:glycosyltransferase involved in cell wall biosynthesis